MPAKMAAFESVAKQLQPFLAIFQSDNPLLPFMASTLQKMIAGLMKRYVKADVLQKATSAVKLLSDEDVLRRREEEATRRRREEEEQRQREEEERRRREEEEERLRRRQEEERLRREYEAELERRRREEEEAARREANKPQFLARALYSFQGQTEK